MILGILEKNKTCGQQVGLCNCLPASQIIKINSFHNDTSFAGHGRQPWAANQPIRRFQAVLPADARSCHGFCRCKNTCQPKADDKCTYCGTLGTIVSQNMSHMIIT
jgi:hypothetical protein